MTLSPTALSSLSDQLRRGALAPQTVAADALARANSNAGRNVYLSLDREWVGAQASALPDRFPDAASRPSLYGLPVSIKDCFDVAGFATTCGSRFYAGHSGTAAADSWVAAKLRSRGAIITGKTHLHQLAYGITGENADYGDCAQPGRPDRLTGGSSSGAAASVREGSAIAAIGTDTGGSIRAPAALCGIAGYRSTLGLGDWSGGAHLAESFDTIGFLFRDLRDGPLLANALFDFAPAALPPGQSRRIGSVDRRFVEDCEPAVFQAFEAFKQELKDAGNAVEDFDSSRWSGSFDIFSPLQASEAAAVHAGFFDRFEPAIAERLAWGASLSDDKLLPLRRRHREFRDGFDRLFERYDFLVLPCAPVSALAAGGDHAAARGKILRYTTPASLAGAPVVAIPLQDAGAQLVGPRGGDTELLAFAAALEEKRRR